MVDKRIIKITNPVDGKYVIDKSGRMTWWQLVATKEEVDMELAKKQLWQLTNQKVLWRHRHPYQKDKVDEKGILLEKKHGHVYGYVLDAKIENEKVYALLSIDGYTSEHRARQNQVVNGVIHPKTKEKIQTGASINVIEYNDRNDVNIKWLHWEEISITPFPACETCLAPKPLKIIMKEQKMSTEINKDDLVETIKEMEKSSLKSSEELKEVSAKIVELETSISKKDEEIASLKDEVEYLTTKKELVDSIIGENKEKEDMYKSLPTEVLKDIIEKMKANDATAQISTENMDDATSGEPKKDTYAMLKKINPSFVKEMEAKAKADNIDFKKLVNEKVNE